MKVARAQLATAMVVDGSGQAAASYTHAPQTELAENTSTDANPFANVCATSGRLPPTPAHTARSPTNRSGFLTMNCRVST
jgi:hypothetical protein